jgi:radical SAM superfamily enzyme YgiQ (UPF0313 family)
MATTRPSSHRSVHLIQPKFPPSYWGQEYFVKMTPYAALYPPLGLITLAALTPPEYEVTVCDEGAGETVDFETDADIIGVTGYLFQMVRVFEIADQFRARGKMVVLGGPMATLLPEECRPHCDVLFEGEAEYTWPRFLNEFATGQYSNSYHEHDKINLPDSPRPRLDVLKPSYGQGIVQCTRGCPFSCEFCDIIVMYGRKVRFKPVEQVLQELAAWHARGTGKVFFADDNFIGHRAYAKQLLRAIICWNSRQRYPLAFYTQASIDMVRDDELLGLLRDANFFAVFLGIESPRKSSLAEAQKTQNEKLDLVQAVHKIQSYNLFISAGMIVGFDNDDPSIFEEQYNFLQEAQIPIVLVNALEAVPRTPLYTRLQAEGRLQSPSYTDDVAAARYKTGVGGTNFRPLGMSGEELKNGLERLYQRLYAPDAFADRLLGNLSRFRDVNFRPERVRPGYPAVFFRLAWHYSRKGRAAHKFFWGSLWKTLLQSPRIIGQMVIYLGMYVHFSEMHQRARSWNPWATLPMPRLAPTPPLAQPIQSAAARLAVLDTSRSAEAAPAAVGDPNRVAGARA